MCNGVDADVSIDMSASSWDTQVRLDDDDSPSNGTSGGANADLTLSPMLQRYPSFVPLRRHATSIAEVAFLVPSAQCPGRQASVMSAVFNMTATIVGGGVLSIPLSCARAGIIPFTLLMMFSAAATDFSLYLLVSCARRCGSTSFGKVAKSSFGSALELITTAVVFFLVGFIVVGLMILNVGIWSPIAVVGVSSMMGRTAPEETSSLQDGVVLLVLLGLMMKFLLKKDLTSLSNICYVGFFSIVILCVAMVYRAVELNLSHPGMFTTNVKWVAASFADVLSALPIVLLAFLCSFNIISVHCSLVDPTRGRVKEVIHKAVFFSFLLMYVFGVAGYLFAYDETNGNILLSFDPKDPVIFLGRIGCGFTTLFALPMNALPCREAFLSLLAQIGEARARRGAMSRGELRRLVEVRSAQNLIAEEEAGKRDEESNVKSYQSAAQGPPKEGILKKPKSSLKADGTSDSNATADATTTSEEFIHVLATAGITTICFVAAVLAPDVAIVWDIAGSSMAFLIQFIIPAACYIKLKMRTQRGVSKHLVLAWALLVFAVVVAILCTTQTALRLAGVL